MRSVLPSVAAMFLASLGAALAVPAAGCSGTEVVGSNEHAETSAEDLADAKAVVALLGGDNGHCSQCHGVTAEKVRTWGLTMVEVDEACLASDDDPGASGSGLSPIERVNCIRSDPQNPSSRFTPKRLGLYAAGARGNAMKEIFAKAFPGSNAEYESFIHDAAMPRGQAQPLTEEEFAKVKAWVLRGMPGLGEAFGGTPTGSCTPSTTPELAAHLRTMKTDGWGARLADQSTPMFGCASASSPIDCLANLNLPDVTSTFGASDVTQKLRQLHEQPLASHYWVRSSADGRYVGYGMNDSAQVIDLTKPAGAPAISVEADYDPYFLPSNDGFAFAGSHGGGENNQGAGSIVLCRQSLLGDVANANAPSITLKEPKCSAVGDDVYMSIGTALDGGRYFMTYGAHENDDGGNEVTAPLPASFPVASRTTFVPMVNDGLAYRAERPVTVLLQSEGDMMLSPSSLLAATRFGDGDSKSLGYRIRFVKAQQSGADWTIDTPLAAEICMPGQKPNFSFDERFVATHQYADPSDPSMTGLSEESSNIMIADLATGKQVRVTASKRGVYALYPHFRADGWLYFAVRDMNTSLEYLVASDIALRMSM